MNYRAVAGGEVIIENEIFISQHLAVCAEKEHAGVEVEILTAVVTVGIPAEAYSCECYRLVQTNALTLRKIYCHFIFLLDFISESIGGRAADAHLNVDYFFAAEFTIAFLIRSMGMMEIAITSISSHSVRLRP